MSKIIFFQIPYCPHCRNARRWMDELFAQCPELRPKEMEIVDESRHPALAAKYDYYFVPAFYVDGKKVHEGVASPEIIRKIFTRARESSLL